MHVSWSITRMEFGMSFVVAIAFSLLARLSFASATSDICHLTAQRGEYYVFCSQIHSDFITGLVLKDELYFMGGGYTVPQDDEEFISRTEEDREKFLTLCD